MRTDEKNTKRAGRFSVLDLVIVLLLLAAILTIGYRYYQSAKQAEQDTQQTILISFEVKDMLSSAQQSIGKEALYLDSTGDLFGVLQFQKDDSLFEVRPAQVIVQDENGNYVMVDGADPTRVDVTGTIKCKGRLNEDGSFLLNGTIPVTPGQTIAVHTEKVSFVLKVVEIPKS